MILTDELQWLPLKESWKNSGFNKIKTHFFYLLDRLNPITNWVKK